MPWIKIRELVRSIVARVCVRVDEVVVSLDRKEVARGLVGEASRELSGVQLGTTEPRAEATLRRAGKGIRLIVGGGRSAKPDRQMIALLSNAYATRDALMSGRDATIDAMAKRLGVKRDYLSVQRREWRMGSENVRRQGPEKTLYFRLWKWHNMKLYQ